MTELTCRLFEENELQIWVKHDYLNHPTIQGNKWHKLRNNIALAKQQGYRQLLTFGGAYSNHIAATAAAGKAENLKTLGIIRGQELAGQPTKWSQTLRTAASNGMQFKFLSRSDYRLKDQAPFLAQLQQSYPDAYIIPEGGSNALAIAGFNQLAHQIQQQLPDWDYLLCPVGTGGTLAGLVANLQCLASQRMLDQQSLSISQTHSQTAQQTLLGIAVLKQSDYLQPQIQSWINHALKNSEACNSKQVDRQINWQLLTDLHLGGYAKTPRFLQSWQKRFEQQFQIPLEPIYNSKMFYGFYKLLKAGKFPRGSKILLIHTGGLQAKKT